MFGNIQYLLSGISVKEEHGIIKITAMPSGFADDLSHDIYKLWSTSKLETNVFRKFSNYGIHFNSFFAPDVLFILNLLLEQKRKRSSPRALRQIVDCLLTETWLRDTVGDYQSKLNFNKLKKFTLKPLPHQQEFLDVYDRNTQLYNLKGFLLAAAPGSGKTFASLAAMACLEKDVVVIFSPKIAVYEVWEATLNKRFVSKPSYWISDRDKKSSFNDKAEYYIFHYEDLDVALELLPSIQKRGSIGVIVDESHNFTDLDALRTKYLVEFCKLSNSNDIIYMSGTPLKAIGSDCVPFLKSVDNYFTDEVETRFKNLYGKSISRANLVLANRLGFVSFKVPKAVVRPEKPTYQSLEVKIPDGDRFTVDKIRDEVKDFIIERTNYYRTNYSKYEDIYNKSLSIAIREIGEHNAQLNLYRNYVGIIRQGYDARTMGDMAIFCNNYELKTISPLLPYDLRVQFRNARSVIKYVKLKIQGEALGRIIGKRRMECTMAMIPYAGLPEIINHAEKKTVVFTSHVEVVEAAQQYFTAQGFKPLVVFAETTSQLSQIVAKFEKDIDANPLIATFKSLSTAVPLVMANTVINLDQPFRPYIMEQAIARVDRLDQDTEVFVYDVLLDTGNKSNISTRSRDILQLAKEIISSIMGEDVDERLVSVESFLDKEDADTYVPIIEISTTIPSTMQW